MDNETYRAELFHEPAPNNVNMPWTIERQLEAYAMHPDATERHKILLDSWRQLKRWLSQMLGYTLASFPAYSLHNETHCQAILHNIECLLGEFELHKLSATDCFVILVTAYLHDIGMVITYTDRQTIIKSDRFREMIEELKNSPDASLQNAAAELQVTCYKMGEPLDESDRNKRLTQLYERKLKVFDSITLLLGEQQRRFHAELAEKKVKDQMQSNSKLQKGFELTQIPMRIFYQAAVCARLHGDAQFTLLDECPEQDGGYAQDRYHPRFIAALLILGDGLDLDNDRFHPFMDEFCGDEFITAATIFHINKHRSIRTLEISPKQILISADCESPEALRVLCNEIDWLKRFLKNCNYHWNQIAPADFQGSLPNIVLNPIRLAGIPIPAEMVTMRFAISQEKAFSLLQGSRIYNNPFTFLREMIQNACDATKLQYWEDYFSLPGAEQPSKITPRRADEILSVKRYPIYIHLWIKKKRRNGSFDLSDVTSKDLENLTELQEKYTVGVLLEVQDYGIGISKQDLEAISKVGTSHERQKDKVLKMPAWLRPTGHFGVGLQSLFLVCDQFRCTTKTRSGECYTLAFYSRTARDGYINVTPCNGLDENGIAIPYGSKFSVFISESFKESHSSNMDGWAGIDPYRSDYKNIRSLRRSVELLLQLDHAIDGFLGEMLFPICVFRHPLSSSLDPLRGQLFAPQKRNHPDSEKVVHLGDGSVLPQVSPSDMLTCWLYTISPKEDVFCGVLEDGSAYMLNTKECKLHIWSQKAQTFFTCSSQRVHNLTYRQNLLQLTTKPKSVNRTTKLFIKGLFVCSCSDSWVEDTFIQEIDIKSDNCNKYLQMNRDGLSLDGGDYLREHIIPLLLETLRMVLCTISQERLRKVENNKQNIITAILSCYRQFMPTDKKSDLQLEQSLAAVEKKLQGEDLDNFAKAVLVYKLRKYSDSLIVDEDGRNLKDFLPEYLNKTPELLNHDFLKELLKDIPKDCWDALRAQIEQIFLEQPDDFSVVFMKTMMEKVVDLQKALPKLQKSNLHEFQDAAFALQQQAFLCAMALFEVGQTGNESADGCLKKNAKKHCMWAFLDNEIDQLLNAIDTSLSSFSDKERAMSDTLQLWHEYAEVPTVTWNAMSAIKWRNIADIIKPDNHFAVFSTRPTSAAKWRHMLVEISSEAWDLLNEVPTNEEECNKLHRRLDVWCEIFIQNMIRAWDVSPSRRENTAGRRRNEGADQLWENLVTRWMVHSIPSIALASDRTGMNRLNILSTSAKPAVFMDSRMINCLLERMHQAYDDYGVERMQTLTLDGLSVLNIKESTSTNIVLVTRGCFSYENKKHRMLTAFRSSLSQAVEPLQPKKLESGTVKLHTIYEVFQSVQESYSSESENQSFLPKETSYIQNICKQTTKQIGLFKDENPDLLSRIRKVQKLFLESNPEIPYQPQDARFNQDSDPKELLNSLQQAYEGLLTDSGLKPSSNSLKWSDISLLEDIERFENTIILRLFNYFPEDDVQIQSIDGLDTSFEFYHDGEEFRQELRKVINGVAYVRQMAEKEFDDIFIESILKWWKENVWNKDPGSTTLLNDRRYDLCTPPSSNEILEHAYLRQIEFYLRALIASSPSPLQAQLKAIEEVRTSESRESDFF